MSKHLPGQPTPIYVVPVCINPYFREDEAIA